MVVALRDGVRDSVHRKHGLRFSSEPVLTGDRRHLPGLGKSRAPWSLLILVSQCLMCRVLKFFSSQGARRLRARGGRIAVCLGALMPAFCVALGSRTCRVTLRWALCLWKKWLCTSTQLEAAVQMEVFSCRRGQALQHLVGARGRWGWEGFSARTARNPVAFARGRKWLPVGPGQELTFQSVRVIAGEGKKAGAR